MIHECERKVDYNAIADDIRELYEVQNDRVYVTDPVEPGKIVRIKVEELQARLRWANNSPMRMAKIYINSLITFVVTNRAEDKKGRENLLQKMNQDEVFSLASLSGEEFEKLQEECKSGNFWSWQVAYLEMAVQMFVEEAQGMTIQEMNKEKE